MKLYNLTLKFVQNVHKCIKDKKKYMIPNSFI